MLEASVIIPVYNTAANLERTVRSLSQQTLPRDRYELIIIDDGSTDHPENVIANYIATKQVIYLRHQPNRGPAYTRNRGLEQARGRLIVFCDGDTVPVKTYLEKHVTMHQQHREDNFVVLGATILPPDVTITPLMHLGNVVDSLETVTITDGAKHNWIYFGTGNLSLKKAFLGELRFDEKTFTGIGYEDTELGYRLAQRGMKLVRNRAIVSWHYHFRDPRDYVNKVLAYGRAIARWVKKCSEQESQEINQRFNFLIDRHKWWQPRQLKEMLRRLLVNDVTAKIILAAAQKMETRDERISAFLYKKLYKYLFLKGYQSEMSD